MADKKKRNADVLLARKLLGCASFLNLRLWTEDSYHMGLPLGVATTWQAREVELHIHKILNPVSDHHDLYKQGEIADGAADSDAAFWPDFMKLAPKLCRFAITPTLRSIIMANFPTLCSTSAAPRPTSPLLARPEWGRFRTSSTLLIESVTHRYVNLQVHLNDTTKRGGKNSKGGSNKDYLGQFGFKAPDSIAGVLISQTRAAKVNLAAYETTIAAAFMKSFETTMKQAATTEGQKKAKVVLIWNTHVGLYNY
ncbi:Uu.00g134280.m01.CDS01 [Anthostomella pinea]|uniref:Uu.00g134280.m01.CDS01 n=1 Tax=Anthostomella pinea TaxID=933095 RepID=A0AAI8YKT9_9PEZI|nr:Uu.00g134280.m01.CDS01 [Anthostomella pinea]